MPLQFTILTKSEDGPCLYWCTGAGESLQAVADTLRLEKRSHTLIACQSADWDRDYSPWPAPPVFDKQGFAGQGEQTLAQIRAFFTRGCSACGRSVRTRDLRARPAAPGRCGIQAGRNMPRRRAIRKAAAYI